jgi:hypothetical protein
LSSSIYIFVLHICGASSHICALFNYVEECTFIFHLAQPSLRRQLIRSYENKGYFVVWQHALLLTKLWRLEFHNAQCTWINSSQIAIFVFFNLPLFLFLFVYIYLIWKAWMAHVERTRKKLMLLNFFKSSRTHDDTCLFCSLLNLNPSHFLQQVQVAIRLSQILISIIVILWCNLFVPVDCPLMLLLWQIFQRSMLIHRRRN